mgnify:CR=1 FL=1
MAVSFTARVSETQQILCYHCGSTQEVGRREYLVGKLNLLPQSQITPKDTSTTVTLRALSSEFVRFGVDRPSITTDEETQRGLRMGAMGALTKPIRSKETLDETFTRMEAFITPRTRRLLIAVVILFTLNWRLASSPLVGVAIGAVVLVVASIAVWIPAHRASTIDPMVALRTD